LVAQGGYDAVHADQTSMAQYALFARSAAPAGARPAAILDQHNALYLLVARQASYESWPWRALWRREARALAGYERDLVREFDQLLTVTEEDREALLALHPEAARPGLAAKISPIPICVDTGSQPLLERKTGGRQIIHLGTMFWPPNIEGVLWFAQQVLPLVWQEAPEARFVVAGKRPPAEVRALAEVSGGRVEVTGFVEDPRALLAESQIFIVPVRAGGGMRVKIVDAWLWGLPVVSTTIGAEGVQVRDGENILLADEPEAFAAAVLRLLREPELGEAMRLAGRRWVEAHYDYRRVYGQFDDVYGRI
jgi:glycosyltransferase involved in cell wall biosynthesis